jgi:hypothetical protein
VTGAGQLPPWGEAPLPAPPAFTLRNVFRTVGPGVIGLGIAIGSGEWLLGPSVVHHYGAALLWITTIAVLLQTLLNLEMGRYTLYTGEPIVTGFMRTWPGPAFWGWTYSLFTLAHHGWPGWALASATASAALVLGRMPTSADAGTVIAIGYATFGACLLIVNLGKKIERTLELAMWAMLTVIIAYLLVLDVATVSGANWARLARGFLSFGTLPAQADWTLLAAFAAFSGLGGMSNVFITNWMRDKGHGMGATVGYIPTLAGGRVQLSPHGNVFRVDEGSLAAWRGWWRFMRIDQWAIFAGGSIAGMALTCALALQYVVPASATGEWAVAGAQAAAVAAEHGRILWYLTLACGFWVLFSTQLGIVDGGPRTMTDILWTGSPAVRRWRGGDVRAVYFVALAVYVAWGCVALNLARPLTLVLIGANAAGVILVFVSLHTLVVNRTLLPPALRPSRWREAALVACALFYGASAAVMLIATL